MYGSSISRFPRRSDLSVLKPEDCTAAETSKKKEAALAYMRDIKCNTRPWKSRSREQTCCRFCS
jgi:hypothetical protein